MTEDLTGCACYWTANLDTRIWRAGCLVHPVSGELFSPHPRHYESTPPLSDPESVQPDLTLLESQFRIARMMSYGPLTDEPGA